DAASAPLASERSGRSAGRQFAGDARSFGFGNPAIRRAALFIEQDAGHTAAGDLAEAFANRKSLRTGNDRRGDGKACHAGSIDAAATRRAGLREAGAGSAAGDAISPDAYAAIR